MRRETKKTKGINKVNIEDFYVLNNGTFKKVPNRVIIIKNKFGVNFGDAQKYTKKFGLKIIK